MAVVRLLLTRGAEMVLNKNHTSFLHEALQNGRKDVVNAVIDSDRYFVNTKHMKLSRLPSHAYVLE